MQSNSYYLLRSFVLMYVDLHTQSSQFLIWYGGQPLRWSLSCKSLPPWIHAFVWPFCLWTEYCRMRWMSFSASDSKNTVTTVLVILITSLSDTHSGRSKLLCGEQPWRRGEPGARKAMSSSGDWHVLKAC